MGVVAIFAATVRQTMASQLQVPLVPPRYNYRHKVQYHAQLRHRYQAHPWGPIYAMCLVPRQPVLDAGGRAGGRAAVLSERRSASAAASALPAVGRTGGRDDQEDYDYDYDTVLGSITVTTTTTTTTTATTNTLTMTKTDRNSIAGIDTIYSNSPHRPFAQDTTRIKKET